MQKELALEQLARMRQGDRLEPHKTLGEIHGGFYDFDFEDARFQRDPPFIVPWTKSARNLDAQVMLIAQDWASEDFLNKPKDERQKCLGHDPKLATNINLFKLLSEQLGMSFGETYATDIFPFVKRGAMSAAIPAKDLQYCAIKYAIPQIEIVKPKLVICIGGSAYNALRRAMGLQRIKVVNACDPASVFTIAGATVCGVMHTGGLGLTAAGGWDGLVRQWKAAASLWNAMQRQ
jgi:uracil-DNA glycosylase